ncbi:MAG: carboxylating nicotinate-nucleotide diphosphorylase [Hyphomonadaceae bacterium]
MFKPPLPDLVLEPIVRLALAEDLGRAGDVTSDAVIDPTLEARYILRARQPGVIAGLDAAGLTAWLVDPDLTFDVRIGDGEIAGPRDTIAEIAGPARSILIAERTMLNFIGRLSGVATLTRAYADAIAGTGAQIAGTRKTTPGLRALEKRALRLGGAGAHRYGLDDAILIKDNHIAAAGGVSAALTRARAYAGHMMVIEIEVDTLAQLEEALPFKPHAILLDNFAIKDLRAAVKIANGACVLEASGGVTLQTARAIAETGVDVVSVGALTHSAPALDVGLDAA